MVKLVLAQNTEGKKIAFFFKTMKLIDGKLEKYFKWDLKDAGDLSHRKTTRLIMF